MKTGMISDTPRTDANTFSAHDIVERMHGRAPTVVPADFARELERELRDMETSERERIVQLEQRLAAAERDAQRYRYTRELVRQWAVSDDERRYVVRLPLEKMLVIGRDLLNSSVDAAVDAAMKESHE